MHRDNSTDIGIERVFSTVKDISEKGGVLVMTTAMKLVEKGKEEGKAEGLKEGEIKGLREAIALGLEIKYGVNGLKLLERINEISSIEKIEAIKEAVKISKDLEEIKTML